MRPRDMRKEIEAINSCVEGCVPKAICIREILENTGGIRRGYHCLHLIRRHHLFRSKRFFWGGSSLNPLKPGILLTLCSCAPSVILFFFSFFFLGGRGAPF